SAPLSTTCRAAPGMWNGSRERSPEGGLALAQCARSAPAEAPRALRWFRSDVANAARGGVARAPRLGARGHVALGIDQLARHARCAQGNIERRRALGTALRQPRLGGALIVLVPLG